MPRNRLIFDLLGLILGVGIAYLLGFYLELGVTGGSIVISVGGFLAGGFILGFFAFKNDGVKIAGIMCGTIALLGIVFGVLMLTGFGEFLEVFSENVITALIGTVLAPVFFIIAIIILVGGVIIGGLFVAAAAIGSAIGEAVWKDKQAEQVTTSVAGVTYQPIKPEDYAPAPAQPQQPSAKVCPNCGISNVAADSFCTNCGAKI